MKFWYIIVAILSLTCAVAAECQPAALEVDADVTVETVDESVNTTLAISQAYAEKVASAVNRDLGPQACFILQSFPYAIQTLKSLEIDVTEFEAYNKKCETLFTSAREQASSGMAYYLVAQSLEREAESVDGVINYALKTKAASNYYTAASFLLIAKVELESLIETANEAKELYNKLNPPEVSIEEEEEEEEEEEDEIPGVIPPEFDEPAIYNKSVGRYHLRKRAAWFFHRAIV